MIITDKPTAPPLPPRPAVGEKTNPHPAESTSRSEPAQETPPPYSRPQLPVARFFGDEPSHGVQVTVHDLHPVNQIFIHKTNENIDGSFLIDAAIPDRGDRNCCEKVKKHKKMKHMPLPNACFHTKNGDISLELATIGGTHNTVKTNVYAGSQKGYITINVTAIAPTRRLNIDASSKKGNMVLFVPHSYYGVIQVRSRRGGLKFLPALAARMTILKETDSEALILLGDRLGVRAPDNSAIADFSELSTKRGTVTLGLSGEDHYEAQEGFWRRVMKFLRSAVVKLTDPSGKT